MAILEDGNEDGFEALVEAMTRNPRPLALLGAGTSVDSGYPDWAGLLGLLKDRAKGKLGNKYQTFLDSLSDSAWQAEEYRRLIGEHEFRSLIASTFAPKPERAVGLILQAIARLQFRHVLTTNYDSCIERAFKDAGQRLQVVDWTEEARMRSFFLDLSRGDGIPYLVYLHGRFYDPGNVILTESSYANRYVRSDDAQRKLFAILITQPVVFIGFSVNDPDLNHLMREANARLGTGNPQHLALVGYEVPEQRELIRNRFEGKYGIRPVFYRIKELGQKKVHGDLLETLQRLYKRVFGLSLPDVPVSARDVPEEPLETELLAEPSSPKAITVSRKVSDSLDQQKGQWGGMSETEDRRIRVENIEETKNLWCTFDLVVESKENAASSLEGTVEFHLHQTFKPDVIPVAAVSGRAKLTLKAYGSFTVGVKADGGATRLELDLLEIADFPHWFKER